MSDLGKLRGQLQSIYDSISHFQPPPKRLPVLDSSLDFKENEKDHGPWIQHENIPGLKKLKETVKIDLDALDKFMSKNPSSSQASSLCTNAPYLIAVWNQVLCAPPPVQIVFKSFSIDSERDNDTAVGSVDENLALTEQEQRERREMKKVKGKEDKEKDKEQQRSPGVKVDVVADYGRRWIRVNTIKNSRILAEFREIDSYFTDSEDSDPSDVEDPDYRPSLAPKEFDNSLLRMGRALIAAANANPVRIPVFSSASGGDSSESTTSTLSHISFKTHIPHVTLRLTRLDPTGEHGPTDPRIDQTLRMLEEMGVEIELGPLKEPESSVIASRGTDPSSTSISIPTSPSGSSGSNPVPTRRPFSQPTPTRKVNLDLSILLALVSDLTHSALPKNIEEAKTRFAVEQGGRYVEWKKAMAEKKKKVRAKSKGTAKKRGVQEEEEGDDVESSPDQSDDEETNEVDQDDHLLSNDHKDTNASHSRSQSPYPQNPVPYITDIAKQTRALTNQVLQEMTRGLLEEMKGRLGLDSNREECIDETEAVEFWTTPEARDRCLRIVEKIGGPGERRRARALLWAPDFSSFVKTAEEVEGEGEKGEEKIETLEQAEEAYWRDSRYGHRYLPLLPLKFYPCDSVEEFLVSFTTSASASSSDPVPSVVAAATPNLPNIGNDDSMHLKLPPVQTLPSFFVALDKACSDTLEQEMAKGRWYTKYNYHKGTGSNYHREDSDVHPPAPTSAQPSFPHSPPAITTVQTSELPPSAPSPTPRTILTKVNPRLTPHTVQSLRWGARLGRTTLTANRTSVKAIVKEVGARRKVGEVLGLGPMGQRLDAVTDANDNDSGNRDGSAVKDSGLKPEEGKQNQTAAIWIVDPRSLAEGMRADLDSFHLVES